MPEQFVTVSLDDILVGEPLPATIYLYIDFRFITFRAIGDVVDRTTYDRLDFKKVRDVFIAEKDRPQMVAWTRSRAPHPVQPIKEELKAFNRAREDLHRKTMDIFHSAHPDKVVVQTIESSKRLVEEVMKIPYAVQNISELQNYSQGTVDHSVNVSVLSVYLAMQMGYSHALILQHVGMGGLLHDIGKPKVDLKDEDSPAVVDAKMQEHPTLGLQFIEAQQKVPSEVKMIIVQHHECHDGSGYPKGIRGAAIYDLARIVSIANIFDALVSNSKGTLNERQKTAILRLDQNLHRKFDPVKLEKTLKILRLGV